MAMDEWRRVLIGTAAEDADAVDEVLEEVGYLRVTYAGEAWDGAIICPSMGDLVAVRLACPPGLVGRGDEEDLRLSLLNPAADARLAGEVLRDTPAVRGEVRVARSLCVDVRDAATLAEIRAGLTARLGPDRVDVEVL